MTQPVLRESSSHGERRSGWYFRGMDPWLASLAAAGLLAMPAAAESVRAVDGDTIKLKARRTSFGALTLPRRAKNAPMAGRRAPWRRRRILTSLPGFRTPPCWNG